ncbi:GGDEF domain-containing protein [Acetobacterium bakii]|uniref:GGDEF domain-containing protein n=1 Tax=Acetobacterium bakii TaxID=52689 RepID=A0A0L6TZ65_9FIRM|nr:GGDEF domain-containing protein [Acetobacterium bakii]KNZ41548.1 hypothetical protein AKG39_11185 [Acetobacterium bakii]
MNYESYSKEQLIETIEELRLLNHQLLADNEQYLIANEKLSDPNRLTKLRNIRNLLKHLIMEINRSSILNKPISIALFEFEGFKKINDTKGYLYCDIILKDVAQIIQSNVRDTDLVGRYTGEEFMIIFSSTSESVAQNISQRIQQAIQQHFLEDNISITVTSSIKQKAGESLEDFIKAAEVNLIKAKKSA